MSGCVTRIAPRAVKERGGFPARPSKEFSLDAFL